MMDGFQVISRTSHHNTRIDRDPNTSTMRFVTEMPLFISHSTRRFPDAKANNRDEVINPNPSPLQYYKREHDQLQFEWTSD